MIKFSVLDTVIIFDFSFLAVMALVFLYCVPETICIAACACMFHELGHIIAALSLGVKINRVVFWAGGIRMIAPPSLASYSRETIVLLSGPAANMLIAAFMAFAGNDAAAGINLAAGLFNLFPYSNLDGGAALRSALHLSAGTVHAIAAVFTVLLSAFITVSGIASPGIWLIIFLLIVFEIFYSC